MKTPTKGPRISGFRVVREPVFVLDTGLAGAKKKDRHECLSFLFGGT
jgi:hypothetical protein